MYEQNETFENVDAKFDELINIKKDQTLM